MRLLFVTICTLFYGSPFAQDVVKPTEQTQTPSAVEEKKKVLPEITIVPVHEPSEQHGAVCLVVPVALVMEKVKQAFPDDKLVLTASPTIISAKDSKGQSVKIVAIGAGGTDDLKKLDENCTIYVYLARATAEVPSVTVLTPKGPVTINEAKVDPSVDPATLQKPQAFRLLGFQPAAPLLDGTTGAAYQIAVDTSLLAGSKLSGILSSSFQDKQAILNLSTDRDYVNVGFAANQLFTNQLLTVSLGGKSAEAKNPNTTYRGQLSAPSLYSGGFFYSRQLRQDSRISNGARLGQGVYYATQSRVMSIQGEGMTKINFNLGTFLFPTSTAREFNTNFFEFNYDISAIFPLTKPSKTRTGYASDGYFLSLGLLGGIQPANGFQQVQGFRFDIVRSW